MCKEKVNLVISEKTEIKRTQEQLCYCFIKEKHAFLSVIFVHHWRTHFNEHLSISNGLLVLDSLKTMGFNDDVIYKHCINFFWLCKYFLAAHENIEMFYVGIRSSNLKWAIFI